MEPAVHTPPPRPLAPSFPSLSAAVSQNLISPTALHLHASRPAHYSPLPATDVLGAAFHGPTAARSPCSLWVCRRQVVQTHAAGCAHLHHLHLLSIPIAYGSQVLWGPWWACLPKGAPRSHGPCSRPPPPHTEARAAMLAWTPANYIGNAAQQAKNLKEHMKSVV